MARFWEACVSMVACAGWGIGSARRRVVVARDYWRLFEIAVLMEKYTDK
jgi:hypothetical protein